MVVVQVLGTLLQGALLLGIVWLIVRAVTKGGSVRSADPALAIRRILSYGLLFATMIVAAVGLVDLFRVFLTDQGDESNQVLARSLAFALVGIPAWALLFRFLERRLRRDEEERSALSWSIYLNAALLTTSVVAMVESHAFLRRALGSDGDTTFRSERIVGALVWGSLWAGHWFVLRRRHGIRGDLHLSAGTLSGLIPLGIGLAGLLYVVGDEFYRVITDDPLTERGGPSAAAWLTTAVIGGVAWSWFWLAHYRRSERTELWYVTVVPIGALVGFVAAVSMSATIVNAVAIWFVGDPGSTSAVLHFDLLPGSAAVLVVGTASWLYHRSLVRGAAVRTDAIRSYDYLLAAASVTTGVVGAVMVVAAALDIGGYPVANGLITGAILAALGLVLWSVFWRALAKAVSTDRVHELRSPLRRVHLFAILGAAGVALLVSVLGALTSALEDVLDGTVTRQTLHDNRIGLAIVAVVSYVAFFHFRVYRSERSEYATPPPPPISPVQGPRSAAPSGRPSKHILLVASDSRAFAQQLVDATGAELTYWHRADGASIPTIDIDALGHRIADGDDTNVLVLIDAGGATIIPIDAGQTEPVAKSRGAMT